MKCSGGCGGEALFRLGVTQGGADYSCASCLLPMLIHMVKVWGRVDVTRVTS